MSEPPADDIIRIRRARHHNLKNLDLDVPLGELIVVTGVSGSGKSSLAFDTLYAEGQRRYVETFSPYARQFLERMDRPQVDEVTGIPPAIAIDQVNPVRTSRSTVGTMTELADHLKLLYARAARLYCRGCGREVRRDTAHSACEALLAQAAADRNNQRALITFEVAVPERLAGDEVREMLARQGYTRTLETAKERITVIQDRVRLVATERTRLNEALESALRFGRGRIAARLQSAGGETRRILRFSSDLHCAECDIVYRDTSPATFSFNSPIGACETCRGFGRTIGIDYALVIPDESLSLVGGAVKPWQTKSFRECQSELLSFARRRGIPTDIAWRDLNAPQRNWVIEGEGSWDDGVWYGVRRFFRWLETKSYRMHIRVLLSRYRAYTTCPACHGARLKPESLLWRLADSPRRSPNPDGAAHARGYNLHQLNLLPIERCRAFFESVELPAPLDQASELLLGEIRGRLRYLTEVGLGYLTLDRQSRTLSGGEVQRINLTTALGTSLVNTLFVLDEPSIGLHTRDMARVCAVLQRLRDAGNTLVVVEHDEAVMRAADRILDLGPGPGERGGEVVYYGPPGAIERCRRSLTGRYLAHAAQHSVASGRRRSTRGARWLEILGAAEHNLKDIDVRIPLERLVCLTGVSGSGKSTLLEDICFRALTKLKGRPGEPPGRHRALRGHENIGAVLLVDQSPIGKTTRSNPASYVGALAAIRQRFAGEPLARERGYTAGTFSFNSGNGRCPGCGGNGFEHVEMQFLSDVYLRCPDCDGHRYRAPVLEVRLPPPDGGRALSIAEVLDLTVDEAVTRFAGWPEIGRALEPLAAVGLGYLTLGQPVPTLSGGEAQRLKLAGHLAKSRRRAGEAGTLLLLDEPTTGLHFEDVATLLRALARLIEAGNSLLVIEHHLDVIEAADWIIDLGPEGGEAGGELLCAGTPRQIARVRRSHTGAALRARWQTPPPTTRRRRAASPAARRGPSRLTVHGAREHNLKGIDVAIPLGRFTVVTGVSGSGKSTLAFDILCAEGQRRYLESLNAYARQFVQPATRPDVDALHGVPPTVAIEQRTSRGGRKSTVATLTEIYHFLRLLFVRLGVQHCPDCALPIEAQSAAAVLERIEQNHRGRRIRLYAPLVVARKGYYTDLARWAAGKGYAELRVDGELLATDPWPRLDRFHEHDIDLPVGEMVVSPRREPELRALIDAALALGNGALRVARAAGRGVDTETLLSTRRACPSCGRSFAEPDPRLYSFNSRHGWCPSCYGTGLELDGFDAEQSGEERAWREAHTGTVRACRACAGRRLNPIALAVNYRGRPIDAYTAMPVAQAERHFKGLKPRGREGAIARDVLAELRARLGFLRAVGLGYLTLDRAAPTLSGGEAQRIRLAAQLGSNLRGVCYVLDEPTIGLHARDNAMLLTTLGALRRKGNTVVVVEHDEDTIRRAEHLIDLGPGAGEHGGVVVAAGTPEQVIADPRSVTGRALAAPLHHPLRGTRRALGDAPRLWVRGARLHNLATIDVAVPLGALICVTGVSGSGKSTLVREILHANLSRLLARRRSRKAALTGCHAIEGWQRLARVLEVDQTPIGKTPRSCPATYIKIWDAVRRLYAETAEARMRGYGAARFSYNVAGGRCDACEGQGRQKIEMSFLPDVRVRCEVCGGARYNRATLEVRYDGRSIAETLELSVEEACTVFTAHPKLHGALRLLQDVGLDYLRLGQPSPTLSGGEAQRLKLVGELARALPSRVASHGKPTLYLLDEPTVGLHMADIARLIEVLQRLVDAGHTVLVIEHNLDIVAEADWIIDLGPDGGDQGGKVVAEGTPEQIVKIRPRSHTARFLAPFLRRRRRRPR